MQNSWLVQRWGMKASFVLASLLFFVGTVLVVASKNHFGVILLGRTLVGLGNGFGMTTTPQYISEISPKDHRGFLTSWSEIACNVGILIGFSMGFVFANYPIGLSWRLMFSMGCILPVVMLFLCCFVLTESPRWLVKQQRLDSARTVLQQLTPYASTEELQEAITDIQRDIEREHLLQQQQQSSGFMGWITLLKETKRRPAIRQMMERGIGIAVAHEMSGIDAIQYYLVFILDASGVTSREAQGQYMFCLGFLKLASLFVASALVDKLGRRPLLLLSLSGMIVSLVVVASAFENMDLTVSPSNDSGNLTNDTELINQDRSSFHNNQHKSNFEVTIAGLALYLIFFSLGLGPLGWILPPELFSTTIRSNAVSLSTFANRLTATFMTSTMLSMANALGWVGYFLSLATINLCTAVLVWLFLPETKGVKLEDVGAFFQH